MGFPVWPKICALSQRWRQGLILGRPHGGRLQVHFPGGNQAQVPGRLRGGAVTPSLHLEVPGIRFVSPGRGLDIRQSMGWTTVCETARLGIWVLKGNARARTLPANLDRLRVEWMKRGANKTAWVTPGRDCLCPYQYGRGAAVRPQIHNAIWDGVIGLWVRVAPRANLSEPEPVLRFRFMYPRR